MKIVFFGSTNLALPVLESLRTNHEIMAVVTTPDAPAGRKREMQETPVSALARDLKLKTLKPESLKNNKEFFAELKNLGADIFVVVAYGKILPADVLGAPKYKTLNVHPSLLPKYRGPSPIRTALLNGDAETGVTFILLDDEVDHGPMISQKKLAIEADDNDFTLTDKLAHMAAALVNEVIADYASGKTAPLPQDDGKATFTHPTNKEDGKVAWEKTAQEIYNQFRAYYIWPGIWTTFKGKKLKITDCFPYNGTTSEAPGTGLVGGKVACGGGTVLQIRSLKMEGKNEMGVDDFLNGYREFTGSKLG